MKKRRFSQTFEYPTVWGFESESQMYESIWNSRPHVSFISGLPITNPFAGNFAHVLPKALDRYPEFRLNPDNIVLVLLEEHNLIDQGSEYQRKKYQDQVKSADFQALKLLETKLLKQYEEFIK